MRRMALAVAALAAGGRVVPDMLEARAMVASKAADAELETGVGAAVVADTTVGALEALGVHAVGLMAASGAAGAGLETVGGAAVVADTKVVALGASGAAGAASETRVAVEWARTLPPSIERAPPSGSQHCF